VNGEDDWLVGDTTPFAGGDVIEAIEEGVTLRRIERGLVARFFSGGGGMSEGW